MLSSVNENKNKRYDMQVLYDSYSGTTLGAYDGDNDSAKLYDSNGNYVGRYFEHELFDKNGMSLGYHDGNPLAAFKKLIIKSMF